MPGLGQELANDPLGLGISAFAEMMEAARRWAREISPASSGLERASTGGTDVKRDR